MSKPEQTQLDRIEQKLDDMAPLVAGHDSDIYWLKRLVGGAGTAILLLASHVLRKLGI